MDFSSIATVAGWFNPATQDSFADKFVDLVLAVGGLALLVYAINFGVKYVIKRINSATGMQGGRR